ncbi:helix-turn-helix domain-containing protein [Nonomuraea sp. PA05]|uniref:AlbA family DNA-binding domain-containing protein n=1 Tax=Nonomuraea sp. PA05 TaxID=2604466 RepID=UPI001651F1F5|nr:ATP-binding protein [Nonomuraea sp. PA05]
MAEQASATSLRNALLRGLGVGEADIEEWRREERRPVRSGWAAAKALLQPWLVTVDFVRLRWEEERDPDLEQVSMDPVRLRLMRTGLFQVQVLLGQMFFAADAGSRSFMPILGEWAARRGARLGFLGSDEVDGLVAELDIPSCRALSVGSLRRLGIDFLTAVRRLEVGHPDAELVLAALAAGEIDSLYQYENSWVEVKRQDYSPGPRGDIEFGQDVARFANSENGGLLVLGVDEKKDGKGSRIKGLHLIRDGISEDRRRKILDSVVYPPIAGLRVHHLEMEDRRGRGSVVVVEVPAQKDELKPFLVNGVIVGDKVEGAFIGIVRRRGEDSITVNIAELHAMITRGRGS